MKKIFLLLILVTACTSLEYIPSRSYIYGLDLTKYAKEDFLITPEMYQGQYLTLGIVNYELYPEAQFNEQYKKYIIGELETKTAIDSIYNYCIGIGADALVRLEIDNVYMDYREIYSPVSIKGLKISGYAIKRLDKK